MPAPSAIPHPLGGDAETSRPGVLPELSAHGSGHPSRDAPPWLIAPKGLVVLSLQLLRCNHPSRLCRRGTRSPTRDGSGARPSRRLLPPLHGSSPAVYPTPRRADKLSA